MTDPLLQFEETQIACLFCRWIKTCRPLDRLGSMVAFADGNPVTPGHLLILPQRHVPDWFGLTRREMRDAESLIRILAEDIRAKDPLVTGFNLGTNAGRSAGQTVFHAHIHLIPRRDGDCSDPKGGVRGVIDGRRRY